MDQSSKLLESKSDQASVLLLEKKVQFIYARIKFHRCSCNARFGEKASTIRYRVSKHVKIAFKAKSDSMFRIAGSYNFQTIGKNKRAMLRLLWRICHSNDTTWTGG